MQMMNEQPKKNFIEDIAWQWCLKECLRLTNNNVRQNEMGN